MAHHDRGGKAVRPHEPCDTTPDQNRRSSGRAGCSRSSVPDPRCRLGVGGNQNRDDPKRSPVSHCRRGHASNVYRYLRKGRTMTHALPSAARIICSPAPTKGLHTAHLAIPLYLKKIFLTIVRRRTSRPPGVGFVANGFARQLGVGDYPGRAFAQLARREGSLGDQAAHG